MKLCLYVNFSNHGYIQVISRDVTNYCLQLPFLVLSEIEQLAKLMAIYLGTIFDDLPSFSNNST